MIDLRYSVAIEATAEHVRLLEEQDLPVPPSNARPRIIIEDAPVLRQAG